MVLLRYVQEYDHVLRHRLPTLMAPHFTSDQSPHVGIVSTNVATSDGSEPPKTTAVQHELTARPNSNREKGTIRLAANGWRHELKMFGTSQNWRKHWGIHGVVRE